MEKKTLQYKGIYLIPHEYEEFKKLCRLKGATASSEIRAFIRSYVRAHELKLKREHPISYEQSGPRVGSTGVKFPREGTYQAL